MPLNPLPDEDNIEATRLTARLTSYAQTEKLVLGDADLNFPGLNQAQWTENLDDVAEFELYRNDKSEIKGSILGANISPRAMRLMISNRVRQRLGLPELTESGSLKEGHTSRSVRTKIIF
jgi:hypothetical protein